MNASEFSAPSPANTLVPFAEVHYSLPELLQDVKRDRTSLAFAMEKLDQAAINSLFDQQQARHDPSLRH